MNNKYKIKVGHPLLRPGLVIETEASENYVINVVSTLMKLVSCINDAGEPEADRHGPTTKDPIAWDKDLNPLYSVGDMPQ